jgi:transposase-like protein
MTRTKKVVCPTCNNSSAMRVQRNGFLQESVLTHFGIYPWKCGSCGRMFLYRSRGVRKRPNKLLHPANVTDPNQESLS